MDIKIKNVVDEWTKPPFDQQTIDEIQNLIKNNNEKELIDRFYKILEFGTGGLRGIIGAGTNRMNIYTVGMATQGLANYIISKNVQNKGVVIAYDSRRFSDVFAKEAASILAANNIKVYLFDDIAPTPICSFTIRELNATAGIVITASHNPPEYNGYKVYWDDGCQVVPPQDKEIIEEVKKVSSISQIKKMDFETAITNGIIQYIGKDIIEKYINKLKNHIFKNPETKSSLKIVYTPLHGTGYKIVPEVLKRFGFDINIVESQATPDGNFPTVKTPNPEEAEALTIAIEKAKEINADIILATDPDADRMGIGFKDSNNEYILINGNQIGSMLLYYLLNRLKENNKLPDNGLIVKTIVTTNLQEKIARYFNQNIVNVLTGFKWIGLKMKEFENKKRFIFGGEESYGYLAIDFVRDKDAVSSCYFFCEMADYLLNKGMSLNDYLNEIYKKFGYYNEKLVSLTLKGVDGMEKIKQIMQNLRNNPPKKFLDYKINSIMDVEKGIIIDKVNNKTFDIDLPKSNVLQFVLENGSIITARPSGTEPKIKFYFSSNEMFDSNIERVKKEVNELNENLANELLEIANKV